MSYDHNPTPSGSYISGPGGGYTAPPPPPPRSATSGTPWNVLSIFGLVVGFVGLLMVCTLFGPLPMLAGIIAVVLGYVGRKQIRESGEQGDGLALTALILGIVAIALGVLETVSCAGLFASIASLSGHRSQP
jgi:hypothetical protein